MITLLGSNQQVRKTAVGGKAYNLHQLMKLGFNVPPALVIQSKYSDEVFKNPTEINKVLDSYKFIKNGHKFAVRSSAIGEDSEDNSFAGIFESYLDVSRKDLVPRIKKVVGSINTAKSSMYTKHRGAVIGQMAVVVQSMIEAEYAGVAFSVNPLENDTRIGLVEVVEGYGENLVSGKKTPATIRVNKLTTMARVLQSGKDQIEPNQLTLITQKILPVMNKIELKYKCPVDIEWAIANDILYLLQVRPITAHKEEVLHEYRGVSNVK